jgi:hypothetical protein
MKRKRRISRMPNSEVDNYVDPNTSPSSPPTNVDAGDYWRWQAQANAVMRLRAEFRAVQAELRQLEPEHERATRELFAKYQINPQRDSIDAETLKIMRGR